jgi:phosphoribosyl-ATP pyrophosphohydrolase
VVEGWQKGTGRGVLERIAELRDLVGGFLVTFVEREGRLQGTDLAFAARIREAAGTVAVTIAGGITTAGEVAALDRLGCDAQVGMALYTSQLGLAEAFAAPLTSDRPDGLWPTVVVDERGTALGLVYADLESLHAALERGQGVYHSRSRGLWVKGESSGAVQELLRVDADCDRDCLRFTVRQQPPGFCHRSTRTCWGPDRGLGDLARRLAARRQAAPSGSYTAKLFEDPALLGAKLREEANELAEATARDHVIHEAADVLYFTLTALARHGVDLAEVEAALDRRALKVTRRE